MEPAQRAMDVDGVNVPVLTTWLPIFRKGKLPKGAVHKTHVGGRPLLPPGDERPRCGHCDVPMPLLIQVHADDDPRPADLALPDNTVLQVFWCADDCYIKDYEGDDEFRACLAQIKTLDERTAKAVAPASGRSEPKRIIEDWKAIDVLPHYLDDIIHTLEADEEWLEAYIVRDEIVADNTTRLGGFPWICQYPAIVSAFCPKCENPMSLELQLQLKTFRTVGWFGNAWIMRCPDHPKCVAIDWGRDG